MIMMMMTMMIITMPQMLQVYTDKMKYTEHKVKLGSATSHVHFKKT